MPTLIPAAMVAADVATQAELDVVSGVASGAATAAALKKTGDSVQVVAFQTGAVATGTTIIPADDTIPQITEGTEFMTLAITPTNASNVLLIEVVANMAHDTAGNIRLIGALFQDAAANALAAGMVMSPGNGFSQQIKIRYRMTAGTTSATTFRFRGGPDSAATVTFNGLSGGRIFGGVLSSSITITEIKA